MPSSEQLSRVRTWMLDGPQDDDNTLGFLLGHMLHWRTHAFTGLTVAPLLAGLWALGHMSPGAAVFVTWILSIGSGEKALKVSPKYNVTENY